MESVFAGPGGAKESAPHILAGVALRSGRQPPVLDPSRAGTGQCGVVIVPAGPSGMGGWFAVGCLQGVAVGVETVVLWYWVVRVEASKVVVVEEHIERGDDWERLSRRENEKLGEWIGNSPPLRNANIYMP